MGASTTFSKEFIKVGILVLDGHVLFARIKFKVLSLLKKSSIERNIRKIITLIRFKKKIVEGKPVFIPNHKNRLFHLLKNSFFIFRK